MPDSAASLRHEQVLVGGQRLHVVRAGEGPPVLLLHGFPEFWYSWRYQIADLAAAGFSVVAPDMRGYNLSEKPVGNAAYDVDELVADVVGLADLLCGGRTFLVGHDWGGIVAWYAAMRRPERFSRLAILNAPHPFAFARDFFTTDQWRRSLYIFLFQVPGLCEVLLRIGNWRIVDEMFAREVFNRDAFAHDEISPYKTALAQPGALTSGLRYYRAALRRARRLGNADLTRIDIPTLLLWGERDPHLRSSLAEGLEPWVSNLTVERFAEAGHWVQLDEPSRVSRSLVEFFTANASD